MRISVVYMSLALTACGATRGASTESGPPLATLDAAGLESLRSHFDGSRDRTRVIALLSPT